MGGFNDYSVVMHEDVIAKVVPDAYFLVIDVLCDLYQGGHELQLFEEVVPMRFYERLKLDRVVLAEEIDVVVLKVVSVVLG